MPKALDRMDLRATISPNRRGASIPHRALTVVDPIISNSVCVSKYKQATKHASEALGYRSFEFTVRGSSASKQVKCQPNER
jgi:hypothetical protein